MIRSVFNLKYGQLYQLDYKRFYKVCYELNGKKHYYIWPGPDIKNFKHYIELVCKEFGVKHFQFIFRKNVYSFTCGTWSVN